jgi:hypothetical protein
MHASLDLAAMHACMACRTAAAVLVQDTCQLLQVPLMLLLRGETRAAFGTSRYR